MLSTATAYDGNVDVRLWVWGRSNEALIAWHLCLEVVQAVGLNLHPECEREAW